MKLAVLFNVISSVPTLAVAYPTLLDCFFMPKAVTTTSVNDLFSGFKEISKLV